MGFLGLKSRRQQAVLPLEALVGGCFLAFSSLWKLTTFFGSWPLPPPSNPAR